MRMSTQPENTEETAKGNALPEELEGGRQRDVRLKLEEDLVDEAEGTTAAAGDDKKTEDVGFPDSQEIFADAMISIPEDALGPPYDLDIILSCGIDIRVEAEEHLPSSHEAMSRTYHAQIDCYQEDDGGPLGTVHYTVEAVGDFYHAFHGYKVSFWEAVSKSCIRLKLVWSGCSENRLRPWQPPPVQEDLHADVEMLDACQGRIRSQQGRREDTRAAAPFQRVLVEPMQKLSIPRPFLEENYDVESALKIGLTVEVNADGTVDKDMDKLFLCKSQNPAGLVKYRVNGMTKLYSKYRSWEIVKWTKVDTGVVCVHLTKPAEDSAEKIKQGGDVRTSDHPSGSDGVGHEDEDGEMDVWEEEELHDVVPAADGTQPIHFHVKAKPFLNPRSKVMLPRRFVEHVLDPARALQHGLLVQLVQIGQGAAGSSPEVAAPAAPERVLLQVPVTVERFQHAQGYSQYRLDGLKAACEQHSDCRLDSWTKVDDDTVQLRVVKIKGVLPAVLPGAAGRPEDKKQPSSRQLTGAAHGSGSLSFLGMPRMPVCLKQGQAVSIPRPFMEQLYSTEHVLQNGLVVEVQPEGLAPLPRTLCGVVCYSNDRGWAQYRIQHDLKSICAQYSGWNVVTWEQIDENAARLVVRAPGSAEGIPGVRHNSSGLLLDAGQPAEGPKAGKRQARLQLPAGRSVLPAKGPTSVSHRSNKSVTLMSPDHFIHVPRTFFQDNYDITSICQNGLHVQIETNGKNDPEIIAASVASYQNNSGYSYFRLLGFKPTSRKYRGWRVDGWEYVDSDTVRMRISGPFIDSRTAPPEASGAEEWGGSHSQPAGGSGEAAAGRKRGATQAWQQPQDDEGAAARSWGHGRRRSQADGREDARDGGGGGGSRDMEEGDDGGGADDDADAPVSLTPEMERQVQSALKDVASLLCLNVRSFRDMFMSQAVKLPAVVQSEIMSVRFNPGFFKTHFPDSQVPKHVVLMVNRGGEVLQDRYESRVVQTGGSEYRFRLPHPLRQACAGWDMVALTKLLEGSLMLHMVRLRAGGSGGRGSRRARGRLSEDSGGVDGGSDLQADHEAAMAIMTLAQAAAAPERRAVQEQQQQQAAGSGVRLLHQQQVHAGGSVSGLQFEQAAPPVRHEAYVDQAGLLQSQLWDQARLEALQNQQQQGQGGLAEERLLAQQFAHQQSLRQPPQQQQVFVSAGPGGGGYMLPMSQAGSGYPSFTTVGGGEGGVGGCVQAIHNGQVVYVMPQQLGDSGALGGQRFLVGPQPGNDVGPGNPGNSVLLDRLYQQQQQLQQQQQVQSGMSHQDDLQDPHRQQPQQGALPNGTLPNGMMWGGQPLQMLHGNNGMFMAQGGPGSGVVTLLNPSQLAGLQQQQGGGNIMRGLQGGGAGGGIQVLQMGPQGHMGSGGVMQLHGGGQVLMHMGGPGGGQMVMQQPGGGMMQPQVINVNQLHQWGGAAPMQLGGGLLQPGGGAASGGQ